jgi:hypothetical protein
MRYFFKKRFAFSLCSVLIIFLHFSFIFGIFTNPDADLSFLPYGIHEMFQQNGLDSSPNDLNSNSPSISDTSAIYIRSNDGEIKIYRPKLFSSLRKKSSIGKIM